MADDEIAARAESGIPMTPASLWIAISLLVIADVAAWLACLGRLRIPMAPKCSPLLQSIAVYRMIGRLPTCLLNRPILRQALAYYRERH
jgi:hypothetical protein